MAAVEEAAEAASATRDAVVNLAGRLPSSSSTSAEGAQDFPQLVSARPSLVRSRDRALR